MLLLNPDVVVLPGAVDALLAFARQHPEHGVYGGRTLRPDGTTDPSSCWGAMSLWSLTCFAHRPEHPVPPLALFDPESLGRWERDTVREVPIVTGCLLLVAREHVGSARRHGRALLPLRRGRRLLAPAPARRACAP